MNAWTDQDKSSPADAVDMEELGRVVPDDREGLLVDGVSKRFGPRILWSDLSFYVPPGVMMALTGASGSGKSTLLNCIGQLERFDAGSMTFNSDQVKLTSARFRRRFRRRELGYLFQNYALVDNATIYDNLDMGVGRIRVFSKRRPSEYDQSLNKVGLGGRGRDIVFRLSGGEQQRVALARVLVKKPKLVLADEPTGALDVANAGYVLNSLRQMAEEGCSVVVATHQHSVAEACDQRLDLG